LEQHADVTVVETFEGLSDKALHTLLSGAEGLIGVGQTIGPKILDRAPDLRVVSTISVGYDYFDVADLTRRGIMLMHTPNVLTDTTADMIFMLMLCVARRAVEMDKMVRQGRWTESVGSPCFGSDVHGKKLGILGMGRIGYGVAKRGFGGFNMEILYYGRSVSEQAEKDFRATRTPLDQLLAESDFVCVTLPLSEKTRKLIGPRELALMKPGAFLINGGRGPIIDETALIEALQNGTIRGAGLDVYEHEPLSPQSPLLDLDNVVLLPHIGSATHETRYAMARCAVDNLLAALESQSRVNCVNPEALQQTP
ncbi:MAG: D-glycerate dehydrogenase, partial [Desulfocapsaceae bacterium]|nr:D-glycerate dehydrogenase [Desulfocapsaceae bacterium]